VNLPSAGGKAAPSRRSIPGPSFARQACVAQRPSGFVSAFRCRGYGNRPDTCLVTASAHRPGDKDGCPPPAGSEDAALNSPNGQGRSARRRSHEAARPPTSAARTRVSRAVISVSEKGLFSITSPQSDHAGHHTDALHRLRPRQNFPKLRHRSDLALCQYRFLHGIHHSRYQRFHHPMSIYAVEQPG
jgi:hypothetical protein